MTYTATYSPEDNKLRLYASSRLDKETYAAVKAAGFRWAPKQDLFVAPKWTPEREDALLALVDEIGDEDTSLVDRAEARAERFEGHGEKRGRDAVAASKAADAIGERFYGGQPILVGHHSEKRARKDQARMHGLMTKAVAMWKTAQYWEARAAGALRNAKYKERPDVRARRIKGLEKEERAALKSIAAAEKLLRFWSRPDLTLEMAIKVANIADHGSIKLPDGQRHWSLWSALTDGKVELAAVVEQRRSSLPKAIAYHQRWLAHHQNRLVYERAMLADAGGLVADRFNLEPGGQILSGSEWLTVMKVNKKGGRAVSVSTNARYVRIRSIEEIKDYRPPVAEVKAAVEKATKLPPLANYKTKDAIGITKAQWEKIPKDYRGTEIVEETKKAGRHRVRRALGVYLIARSEATDTADFNQRHKYWSVFITPTNICAAG